MRHPKETVCGEKRRGARVDYQGIPAFTFGLEEEEPADAAENSGGKSREAEPNQAGPIWRPRKDGMVMEGEGETDVPNPQMLLRGLIL